MRKKIRWAAGRFLEGFRLGQFGPEVKILFLSRLLLSASFSLSFVFLPIYFERRGISLSIIGVLMAGNLMISALGNLLGGPLSDGLGSRKTIVWSVKLRVITTSLVSLIVYLERSPVILVVLYYANTFLGFLLHPAADSFVSKRIGTKSRQDAFSFMRVGINAGGAMGLALGGFLVPRVGYPSLFALTAAGTLINAFLLDRSLLRPGHTSPTPEKNAEAHPAPPPHINNEGRPQMIILPIDIWSKALKQKVWVSFCLWGLIASIAVSQLFGMMSLYLKHYRGQNESVIGLLFTVNCTMVVLLQAAVTRFLATYSLAMSLAIGMFFYGAGYLILGFATTMPWLIACIVMITLGEVIFMPGYLTMAANLALHLTSHRYQGTYIGMAQFVSVMGGLLASVMGGASLQHVGQIAPWLPWMAIAAIAVFSATGFLALQEATAPTEVVLVPKEAQTPPIKQ